MILIKQTYTERYHCHGFTYSHKDNFSSFENSLKCILLPVVPTQHVLDTVAWRSPSPGHVLSAEGSSPDPFVSGSFQSLSTAPSSGLVSLSLDSRGWGLHLPVCPVSIVLAHSEPLWPKHSPKSKLNCEK